MKKSETVKRSKSVKKIKSEPKLALLIYDVDYDDEVMDLFTSDLVPGFTKWDKVQGTGKSSDPKMDTAVWPGHNSVILALLTDEIEEELKAKIMELINKHNGSGMKLFTLPLHEVI
ncbi:MAG: transcriptional regulator [Spirochaetota bacterium]|nr:transcriptional regulator [Spirochaetota bacterium]